MRRLLSVLEMIKWQHTVFALPMALAGAALAWAESPSQGGAWWVSTIALVVLATVAARFAAMTYNRWADRDIDATNPRTADRPSVTGEVTPASMLLFTGVCCAAFVAVAWLLNPLAFRLSVPFLAVLLGYSHAKRFTVLAHVWLGVALGLSPLGAWIAVLGTFDWTAVILGLAVVPWVAGFDILYALADVDHDRREGLHSIPARIGPGPSKALAAVLHLMAVGVLVALWASAPMGAIYLAGVAVGALILLIEHALVWRGGLETLPHAFLTCNGLFSLAIFLGVVLDVSVGR